MLLKEIFLAIGKHFKTSKPNHSSLVRFFKALPLYHWFVDSHPTKPFTELDVKPNNIKELLKSAKCFCSQKSG